MISIQIDCIKKRYFNSNLRTSQIQKTYLGVKNLANNNHFITSKRGRLVIGHKIEGSELTTYNTNLKLKHSIKTL